MIDEPQTTPSQWAYREKRMRRLAWLLDESIRLPGGFRIGVDGILGLIPGIGDMAGAIIGSYLIYQARQLGAPRTLLFRMLANTVLEAVIGSLPLAGDLFDFYFKANSRNLKLLQAYCRHREPPQT